MSHSCSSCAFLCMLEKFARFATITSHSYLETLNLRRTLNPGRCIFQFKATCCREINEILGKLERKRSQGYNDIPVSLIINGAAPISKLISCYLKQYV